MVVASVQGSQLSSLWADDASVLFNEPCIGDNVSGNRNLKPRVLLRKVMSTRLPRYSDLVTISRGTERS